VVALLILLLYLFVNCAWFWDRPKFSTSSLTWTLHSTHINHLNVLLFIIKLTRTKSQQFSNFFTSLLSVHFNPIVYTLISSYSFQSNSSSFHVTPSYPASHCYISGNSSHKWSIPHLSVLTRTIFSVRIGKYSRIFPSRSDCGCTAESHPPSASNTFPK